MKVVFFMVLAWLDRLLDWLAPIRMSVPLDVIAAQPGSATDDDDVFPVGEYPDLPPGCRSHPPG